MTPEIQLLVDFLEQAFRKKSWHGANLLGSLRGLSPTQAAWRPAPKRHNIWEHILHTAYWKYSVSRRLLGGDRGSFPIKGSNWFSRPQETTPAALKKDLQILKQCHEELLQAVLALQEGQLQDIPPGSSFTFRFFIMGVASHDLYHAGQIQLIKRLMANS